MRHAFKILLVLLAIYVVFFAAAALLFDRAEHYQGWIVGQLSKQLDKDIQVEKIHTQWQGLNPKFRIDDIQLFNPSNGEKELQIDSLAVVLDGRSLLRFWPQVIEVAAQKPQFDVVLPNDGPVRIAGFPLSKHANNDGLSERLVTWLLNYEEASVVNAVVDLKRPDQKPYRYDEIAFRYQREQQQRGITIRMTTPKGDIALSSSIIGDILASENWDANVEMMHNGDEYLLQPNALTVNVKQGQGVMSLTHLDVERVRDAMRLLSIRGAVSDWVRASRLSGELHNITFRFEGSLTRLKEWSFEGSASNVGFTARQQTPGMNNLQGSVRVDRRGGQFAFSSKDAVFSWPEQFYQRFPVNTVAGELVWSYPDDERIAIELRHGRFVDKTVQLEKLNAKLELHANSNIVRNLADLFDSDSLSELEFDNGQIIDPGKQQRTPALFADVKTQFSVASLSEIQRYFPRTLSPRFISWWKKAFQQGRLRNGSLLYQGQVSTDALKTNKAIVSGNADAESVIVDYGPRDNWPRVLNGTGKIRLDNRAMTIEPSEVWLENNQVERGKVVIHDFFSRNRFLQIDGALKVSLPDVFEFLFQGPLIKSASLKANPPLIGRKGSAATELSIRIPLNKVRQTTVAGRARIKQGAIVLPGGVAVDNINGVVDFTEQSVTANKLLARAMDGDTEVSITTLQAAQPPKLGIKATGVGHPKKLQPWLGQVLVSFFDGLTPWESDIVIDDGALTVDVQSELDGIVVNLPAPLGKDKEQGAALSVRYQTGDRQTERSLKVRYDDVLAVDFKSNLEAENHLLDMGVVRVGKEQAGEAIESVDFQPGVYFRINTPELNLDQWLQALIDMASLPTGRPDNKKPADSRFLDNMRGVSLNVQDATLLSKPFAALSLQGRSVDGASWVGTVSGDNVNGTLQVQPRQSPVSLRANLADLRWVSDKDNSKTALPEPTPEPINANADPAQFPDIELTVNRFFLSERELGRLMLAGKPEEDRWQLNDFRLSTGEFSLSASGQWVNDEERASVSEFEFSGASKNFGENLASWNFADVMQDGKASMTGMLRWAGGPNEFAMQRLNGDYKVEITNGQLVQVEPGSGKVFGLFNVNALTRRLRLDFSDIFSSGLEFDRMKLEGKFADGNMVLDDAYIFSPAVFVQAEGGIDLANQQVDVDVHVSPELGGNLTLLSALANPAAGAVMFITQRLFGFSLLSPRFVSYRAKGSWDELDINKIDKVKKDDVDDQ